MVRRVMLLVAIGVMVLVVAACGGNSVETPSDAATTPPQAGEATQPPEDAGGSGDNAGTGGNAGNAGAETDNGEDDDNNEQGFDPFPFGTPVPEEEDANRPLLEPTLAALGAPVRPTVEATAPPFGGLQVTPGELGRPGEVTYADDAEATEPVVADADDAALEPTVDPATLLFDKVTVVRVGGPGGRELTIEVFQDGAVLMDGQRVTTLTPQAVIELDTLLDEIRIFEMRGIFASTFPDRDDYRYVISVNRADGSISHRADDSLMPPELGRVVQVVTEAVVGAPPAPNN